VDYLIKLDDFKKRYFPSSDGKVTVRHDHSKNIIILPYTTKYENKHKELIENFKYVLGEFCRIINGKKIDSDEMDINNIDHYLENTEVDTENKTALKMKKKSKLSF